MMNDIIVIDNFLERTYHAHLLNELTSSVFPWYYQSNISHDTDPKRNNNDLGNFGFAYWIKKDDWTDTNITKFLIPFCYKVAERVSATSILRVRLDMTMFNPLNHIHQAHVDYTIPHISSVYYVNDSDGDTVIYNEKYEGKKLELEEMENFTIKESISPKANRLLLFDGKHYHTGHSPSKHKNRILINSNYVIA